MKIYRVTDLRWNELLSSTCGNYSIETSTEEYILHYHDDFCSRIYPPCDSIFKCKELAQTLHEQWIEEKLESMSGVERVYIKGLG